MSLFRPTLLAALVFAGLTACNDPAAPSTEVAAPAPDSTAPASAAEAPATAAVPAGDAAALDARLVELGWAGAAATTHAYAQACGASAGQLEAHKAAQRDQAIAMGSEAGEFDRQFAEALTVATRRVELDDVAMSDAYRAETCETTLASLR
jgi:hypothetical protein